MKWFLLVEMDKQSSKWMSERVQQIYDNKNWTTEKKERDIEIDGDFTGKKKT